ncbi:MAG TPA: prepilin-type N-terminal cleavage/methylation domain-containing protein [Gemmatimonadales bacterium]|nr:prepilin-type N-terminal cleavage/methylation domain-containing protein [Gemmatimonadales bacterium]
MLNRRGFTLVELLIALVLLSIVSLGIYKTLMNNQRIYIAQTQHIDLQQNIRAAATILPAEFREIDARDSDISAMSPTAITFRAMRVFGFACDPPALGAGGSNPSNLNLTVREAPAPPYGSRDFANGDSILLYYEGNTGSVNDDSWIRGKITAAPVSLICTDTKAGEKLVVSLQFSTGQSNVSGAVTSNAPIWGFETVTYRVYKPAGDSLYYVGYQNSSGTQPIIGPLASDQGLNLVYMDSLGNVTADRTKVAQIQITLRGRTQQYIRQTSGTYGAAVDSVITTVALRNNCRFGC